MKSKLLAKTEGYKTDRNDDYVLSLDTEKRSPDHLNVAPRFPGQHSTTPSTTSTRCCHISPSPMRVLQMSKLIKAHIAYIVHTGARYILVSQRENINFLIFFVTVA